MEPFLLGHAPGRRQRRGGALRSLKATSRGGDGPAGRCCSCLTGKDRSGCHGPLCERDVVPEAFELFDEALGLAFGVALGEVIGAEVAVGLAGGKHVPDRAEQGVLDGAQGAFVAASWLEALVLRGGVVGLDADGGHGGFFEGEVPPLRSVARLAGAALAGRLVVAWALPRP